MDVDSDNFFKLGFLGYVFKIVEFWEGNIDEYYLLGRDLKFFVLGLGGKLELSRLEFSGNEFLSRFGFYGYFIDKENLWKFSVFKIVF